MTKFAAAGLLGAALSLGGCGLFGGGGDSTYPSQAGTGPTHPGGEGDRQTIFGEGGLTLFGGDSGATEGAGIGVNSFLWRASLDTIAFMPLASADPFGGVIITDWYQDPKTPGERFKITVYIMDRRLRADGVKVAVFRQVKDGKDVWSDAATNPQTGPKIENAILVRARQLRIDAVEAGDTKSK